MACLWVRGKRRARTLASPICANRANTLGRGALPHARQGRERSMQFTRCAKSCAPISGSAARYASLSSARVHEAGSRLSLCSICEGTKPAGNASSRDSPSALAPLARHTWADRESEGEGGGHVGAALGAVCAVADTEADTEAKRSARARERRRERRFFMGRREERERIG